VRAYKFLAADGRAVFSGFAWPLPNGAPGDWVETRVELCRSGVHACRPGDLAYWLAPTLYEIELGATVMFAWHGFAVPRSDSTLELVGSITHVTEDQRYRRLNDVVCALTGEVRRRVGDGGYEVVLDVAELVWEPLE
jgi:hypothetical protein